ncbi:MAG TPA: helix-turn-helix domain-containing protein [Paludibacter sp.]
MIKNGNIETNDWIRLELEVIRAENKRIIEQNDEIIRLLRAGHSMPPATEKIYTTEEVMAMLQLSRRTLLTYRKTGKINYKQEGNSIRFLQSHIDDFMRNEGKMN